MAGRVFGNDRPTFLRWEAGKSSSLRGRKLTGTSTIACEGQGNVGLRILEKAEEAKLPNIKVWPLDTSTTYTRF